MFKPRTFTFFFFSIFFLLIYNFIIFAEDITITTYYPSPEGVYSELRTNKLVVGDSDSTSTPSPDTDGVVRFKGINSDPVGANDTEPGVLYYNTSDNKFKYHDGTAWLTFGGGGYCYTYYSTSSPCVCPAGETNKKDLGVWGNCHNNADGTFFRPPGLSCLNVWPWPMTSTNRGTACVCCEN